MEAPSDVPDLLAAEMAALRAYVMDALVAHGGVTAPKTLRVRVRQLLAALAALETTIEANDNYPATSPATDTAMTLVVLASIEMRCELLCLGDGQRAAGVDWRAMYLGSVVTQQRRKSVQQTSEREYKLARLDLAPDDRLLIYAKMREQVGAVPALDALIAAFASDPPLATEALAALTEPAHEQATAEAARRDCMHGVRTLIDVVGYYVRPATENQIHWAEAP